jgi:formylmethanofuran dehydrogenase subunit E
MHNKIVISHGSGPSDTNVCGRPLAECLQIIERFHGWKAPGLVLGLFMVDWARELIGEGVEADAIVETRHCLPDAIQLFTPCTVGNGWLKILDWDKFALSLYDRHKRYGYRVWLDLVKTRPFKHLYNWYMRLVSKKDLPLDVLNATILEAGRAVLSAEKVCMTRYYRRIKKDATAVCDRCGEAYAADQGPVCAACQGEGYYRPVSQRDLHVVERFSDFFTSRSYRRLP